MKGDNRAKETGIVLVHLLFKSKFCSPICIYQIIADNIKLCSLKGKI